MKKKAAAARRAPPALELFHGSEAFTLAQALNLLTADEAYAAQAIDLCQRIVAFRARLSARRNADDGW